MKATKEPKEPKQAKQRRKLRVMLALFEASPFLKTGGLGDVGGSLPGALKRVGIRIFPVTR